MVIEKQLSTLKAHHLVVVSTEMMQVLQVFWLPLYFCSDESVQELAVELVQLGFISEVCGVNHHDPADLNTFPLALLIAANQTKPRRFAFPLPMQTPFSTPKTQLVSVQSVLKERERRFFCTSSPVFLCVLSDICHIELFHGLCFQFPAFPDSAASC